MIRPVKNAFVVLAKSIIAEEEERLRKENESLKEKVGVLLNRLTELESRRGGSAFLLFAITLIRAISFISVKQYSRPAVSKVDVKPEPVKKTPPAVDPSARKDVAAPPPEAKKPKGEGKGKSKPAAPAAAANGSEEVEPDVSRLDMRVGRIVKAEKHPDADALYVEEVDLGESIPRTVVSGLVKHIPLDQVSICLFIAFHAAPAFPVRLDAKSSGHPTVQPQAGQNAWSRIASYGHVCVNARESRNFGPSGWIGAWRSSFLSAVSW